MIELGPEFSVGRGGEGDGKHFLQCADTEEPTLRLQLHDVSRLWQGRTAGGQGVHSFPLEI